MTFVGSGSERRQFGRRPSAIPAFIEGVGREPLPCTVRNVSISGAFLEVSQALPAIKRVRLVIPSLDIDLRCEVCRQTDDGVGVKLMSVAIASYLYQSVKATPAFPDNIPAFVPDPTAAAEPTSNRQLRMAMIAKPTPPAVEIPPARDGATDVKPPAADAAPATTPSPSAAIAALAECHTTRRPPRVVSSRSRAQAETRGNRR